MKDKFYILIPIIIFCLCVHFVISKTEKNIVEVISDSDNTYSYTVILDAGHGGEDGGAVAYEGTLEKDINLLITDKIAMLFDLFGIAYSRTRTDDSALGDTDLPTIKERKASDIHHRFDLINSFRNSLLLSIHQNYFPVEKYCGAQVFYSGYSGSELVADYIQTRIKKQLQIDNNRVIKQSESDIYLLYNAQHPSVMVECGFMSNPEELSLLKDNNYQKKLSYLIVRGMMDFFNYNT